ncbi:MAG: hypothetical protein AAGB46_19390 [Verrucomicrobiota bacterium]
MNPIKTETNAPETSRSQKWPSPLNRTKIEASEANSGTRERLIIKPKVTLDEIARRARMARMLGF